MPRPHTPQGEPKIEKSQKKRVYWRPGQPHPLDALDDELAQTLEALPGQLETLLSAAQHLVNRLSTLVEAAREHGDLSEAFTQSDQVAHLAILERFGNRKHLHHLLTAFALQRQKRLLGRLRTIEAALTLTNELLAEEESLSQEFLTTWQTSATEHETLPSSPEELEDTASQETPPPTREELRVQGLDAPLQPLVGSATHARHLLRDFEAQLPDLRRQLSTGQGWFEIFYVPKRHYKPEVLAYAYALAQERNTPIPPEILDAVHPEVATILQAGGTSFPKALREYVYDITPLGPYAKYRWTEAKRTYTISLGLLDDYPPFPFTPQGF